MTGQNGNGPGGLDQRISYQVPYAAAMGLVLLILYYEGKARRRERQLLAQVADARELKHRAGERQREAEEKVDRYVANHKHNEGELRESIATVTAERDARVSLPTDALAIVTTQGQLCPLGLDHAAGSDNQTCPACIGFLNHFKSPGERPVTDSPQA